MRTTTLFRTSAVATIFAVLLSAGTVLADRDGEGGGGGKGGGGGDGGGGGGRSGNSDRGGSSRSSDGGGDRSSRSSSRSSDSNKGNSNVPSTFRSSKGSGDSNKDVKDFQPPKQFQGKPDQSGSKGSRDYQALRPSDDKVRDFLKDSDKNKNDKNNNNADQFKNRNPKDREVVDREYNKWQNTWNGDKNNKNDKGNKVGDARNGHDNRDWSGKWKNSDRFTTADRIRNDWRGRKGNDFVFNDNWWNNKHRGNYWNFWGDYGRRNRNPYYWWGGSNGQRLGSWFVFGWPSPYYWDYGQGEYIYANNGVVYVNGNWYAPAPVFYQQTEQLVNQSALTADAAAKLDWMPLGVFAATPDGLNEPDVTVQLAVTKEGQIGGTAFDPKTNAAFNIQGTVDKKTQRAVWSYTNDRNQRIMMETSVYNLTQPEATGLVHYSPTDMRVVELVRLEQPEAGAGNSSPSLPAPPLNQ